MGRINASEQKTPATRDICRKPKEYVSTTVSVPWRFSFKYEVTKVCVAVWSSSKSTVTKECTTWNLLLWLFNGLQKRINVHTICLDSPWILNTPDIVSVCYNRWKRAKPTGSKLDSDPPGSLNLCILLLCGWPSMRKQCTVKWFAHTQKTSPVVFADGGSRWRCLWQPCGQQQRNLGLYLPRGFGVSEDMFGHFSACFQSLSEAHYFWFLKTFITAISYFEYSWRNRTWHWWR